MYADVSELGDVAPARERGLKYRDYRNTPFGSIVAPARERGLKSMPKQILEAQACRSRKGAWIEISL